MRLILDKIKTVLLLLTLLTKRNMTELTRREREIQELRSKIIDQSWIIISNEGLQALSIRKIADAIEYSVPVIYKHFENKEAILAHFSREGYALLSQKINLVIEQVEEGAEKIKVIAKAYWDFAVENTHHYRIMFGLGIPACETINSSTEMKLTSNYMLDAIVETLALADNQQADKYLKLKTFWSMLHGFIAIELLSNKEMDKNLPNTVQDAVDGFIFTLKNNK